MEHQEYNYWTENNKRIFYQSWREDVTKKGIVQIVHGIVEHSGRYDSLAKHLASNGYIVYGHDHLGHGKSGGRKFFINNFNDFVTTTYEITRIIKKKEDNSLPLYILGHSMGSIIGLLCSEKYHDDIDGLILSGAGYTAMRQLNKVVLKFVNLFSPIIGKKMLSTNINEDLLTNDPNSSEQRKNDPLVSRKSTLKLGIELYRGYNQQKRAVQNQKRPIFMQRGEKDRVVYNHEKFFKDIGPVTDKQIKIYPKSLHEIYNELEEIREQVIKDLILWLDEHSKVHQKS